VALTNSETEVSIMIVTFWNALFYTPFICPLFL